MHPVQQLAQLEALGKQIAALRAEAGKICRHSNPYAGPIIDALDTAYEEARFQYGELLEDTKAIAAL